MKYTVMYKHYDLNENGATLDERLDVHNEFTITGFKRECGRKDVACLALKMIEGEKFTTLREWIASKYRTDAQRFLVSNKLNDDGTLSIILDYGDYSTNYEIFVYEENN